MAHGPEPTGGHETVAQQHPLGIYFKIWGLLFILSAMSYMVDIAHFEGFARWSLILIFMVLKAGLIMAVFMHMAWERLSLIYMICTPVLLVLLLVWIMVIESDYTFWTRILFGGS